MQRVDKTTTKRMAASGEKTEGFTDAERAAMRARVREPQAEVQADNSTASGGRSDTSDEQATCPASTPGLVGAIR